MKNIKLSDYTYHLPQEKIATHGLKKRDNAKLLVYQGGEISHHTFSHLPGLLPNNSTLFFNDTKVIQARLLLKRNTGAIIEVFLLKPANPALSIYDTLKYTKQTTYHCMIGNLKKWREGEELKEIVEINKTNIEISVTLINKSNRHVQFSWNSVEITFADILKVIGHTPLPPYIKRDDEKEDKMRYQTVYSKQPGAVAAPTAGMHFTKKVLSELSAHEIRSAYLTLHVSAGTFQPIKDEHVIDHPMHNEQIIITRKLLYQMLAAKNIIAIGTTSLRTLESIYWYGVQILLNGQENFHIGKLVPYHFMHKQLPDKKAAINAVLNLMQKKRITTISGTTEIFIIPGYDFKTIDGLITNFHQPGSTLILLVAAFVGENWQRIYKSALNKNYRFLSYGDSSLLLKS